MPRLPIYTLLEEKRVLPVGLVKELVWCPVIPWIAFTLGFSPPLTPSMASGLGEHSRLEFLEGIARRLSYRDPEFNVYLYDGELGVVGVADIVSREDRVLAEVKKTSRDVREPGRHELVQVLVYALLAWRRGLKIYEAHLVYAGGWGLKVYRKEIGGYELGLAERAVERLWRIVVSPEPPLVEQPREKCGYCRYRRVCPFSRV